MNINQPEASELLDLWSVFSRVPDHRRAEGKRYPLPSLLIIALAAMLAGRKSQAAIVRWGQKLSVEALEVIGICRGRVPAPSVWCEFFQGLNVAALELALTDWVRGNKKGPMHVAIDGKRLRGSRTASEPGKHLLAAFCDELSGVIGQLQLDPGTNEITAALKLLKNLDIEDAIITGDAIFTQKEICRTIIDGGGDYFFTVKRNQPELHDNIALTFESLSPLSRVDTAT